MKSRKSDTIIDIIIAILFISGVLYFCYSLATSSINKRQQTNLEREATSIAENIINRVTSQGVYTIESEPMISESTLAEINLIMEDESLNLTQKNKRIVELGERLPVNREIDAPFLPAGDNYSNRYSYQVIVDDVKSTTGTDSNGNPTYSKSADLKRIIVNVYYPTKVVKYLNSEDVSTEEEIKDGSAYKNDLASLEEEYRVVTLTTYKASREYEIFE